MWWWTEAAISSQFLCRAEGGCEFRELPLVMLPSKVCPQCNAVVPIRLKVCRNRLKFALYNADRVNFKSRNYHVVAYNISILAEGLHFSALVIIIAHAESDRFCDMVSKHLPSFPHEILNCLIHDSTAHREAIDLYTQSFVSVLESCSLLCFPSFTSSPASLPKLPGWNDGTGKLQNMSVFWHRVWVEAG